ncbi:boi-related E3 ubiquitin-protein ligase 1 [Phtheirospermum japonicum]|uniref:Boi-related E3 ubiquitin-protein ligase 1 n=1 Tax=Phtheirospermum japonicum TaxID=374723 RepID=A0A830B4J5_9LAMI|nr:boi-related E3 ubiquitin-protein ligase 1 [Phtheirospermum japonicum]
MQQKLGVPLNSNVYQDEHGHIGASLNPNLVSTGLRLFCEKNEHSSSVNSITCENVKNTHPGVFSLGSTIKTEINRQTEELCQYIKHQEENISKGGRELNQRHTISLFNALEKAVNKKMHEKDLQIENANRKNKELEDRIKQVTMEAQSWHNRSKHNESVANVLKSNIQQIMEQGLTQGCEGFGDSEVDVAVSCMNRPGINSSCENQRLKCRACQSEQVSILLFPCRHLCLCADCEGLVDVCPVCQVTKTASFPVCM